MESVKRECWVFSAAALVKVIDALYISSFPRFHV